MFQIIGLLVVFIGVFGGYAIAGGSFTVILAALPFESMMILGASIGAFLVANSMHVIKGALKATASAFKGPKWKSQDFTDLLCLMFELMQIRQRKGNVAIASHVENPSQSDVFGRYPKIQDDHHLTDFITGAFLLITLDYEDPNQMEDNLDRQIKRHHHEDHEPVAALQTMADGLPAIGIVAAVLGVIKTMSSIDQPPEILGKMIGGALVGTFLGVFLSYTIVAPLASRARQVKEHDAAGFVIVKSAIIAMLNQASAQSAIEIARNQVPENCRPSFVELEASIKQLPKPV